MNTGNINTHLNQFNQGGTHEQNPLGGIPMGQNASVEEGETMKGNFVYSDRVILTPDIIGSLGLPKALAGKTASEASKIINKKFEDRSDNISESTKTSLLDKIAQAQESVKAQEQQQLQQAMDANSTMDPEDQMNGQIPQGMDEYVQPEQEQLPTDPSQMAYGGRVKMFGGGDPDATYLQNVKGSVMSDPSSALGSLGSLVTSGQQIFGKSKIDTSGLSDTPDTALSGGKQALSGALSGAAQGAKIGGLPGAAVMGTIGLVGGLISGGKDKRALLQAQSNREQRQFNTATSDFAYGGEIEPDKYNIKDTRKIRATTNRPIDPNRDLVTGKYDKKRIDNVIQASVKNYENPYTMVALGLAESGYKEDNIGQVLNGSVYGDEAGDMVRTYINKKNLTKNSSEIDALTRYNGTGKVGGGYDGAKGNKIKQMYGVPIPKEGLDMGKTKLYAKNVLDLRDNVISKDPEIRKSIEKYKKDWNPFEGEFNSKTYKQTTAEKLIDMGKNLPVNYALGGELNTRIRYAKGGLNPVNEIDPRGLSKTSQVYTGDANMYDLGLSKNYIKATDVSQITPTQITKPQQYSTVPMSVQLSDKLKSTFKDNIGEALSFAPVLTNALQLKNLKKPEVVNAIRNDRRFKYDPMDTRSQLNIAQSEMDNTVNALSNANMSQGALSNSILAAGLNKNKVLSDAYFNAANQNNAMKMQGQSFDNATDEANIARQINADEASSANRGAYESAKSKLIADLGTNVGKIGKGVVEDKMVRELFGYTKSGNYYIKANGSVATPEEVTNAYSAIKGIKQPKPQAKGGYINKYKSIL